MDRRAFMMSSAWLPVATGATLPWMSRAIAAATTVALADTSLVAGRGLSRDAARRGLEVFDLSHECGADIGALWHATLAPRLAASPGVLIGIARASDYFVLAQFAVRSNRMVEHQQERCAGRNAPVAFLLAPVVHKT